MESVQTSDLFFFGPIILAYLIACVIYLLGQKYLWIPEALEPPAKRYRELLFAFLVIVAIIILGQLYSAGYLISGGGKNELMKGIIWILNNVIIYSPVFVYILLRRQSIETIYLNRENLLRKLIFGLVAGIIATCLFLGLRQEIVRFPEVMRKALSWEAFQNFPAVFFEGVVLAFLFVRLCWALNRKWALLIPAILFAAAHIPGMLAEDRPWMHIFSFSLVTGSITVFVLYTLYRSKDILWLGIVHYLLDIAIRAF